MYACFTNTCIFFIFPVRVFPVYLHRLLLPKAIQFSYITLGFDLTRKCQEIRNITENVYHAGLSVVLL